MWRKKLSKAKSGMALNRRRSKWLIFRLFLPVSYTACPSKLWLIQSSILGDSMKDICHWYDPIRERFLTGLLLYVMMQSLIDWLNEHSWLQLPWTAPVSVLGHSWPTFSLFLPVQSSLFNLPWAEFSFRPVSKTRGGGVVNNLRVTLVFIIEGLPRWLHPAGFIKPWEK